MNADIKKRWIDALRSGPYKQAQGALKTDKGFCCLGVLCDLYRSTYPVAQWEKIKDKPYAFCACDNSIGSQGILPPQVTEWADLETNDPVVEIEGVSTYLSEHNDGTLNVQPRDFNTIAQAIEEQL